MYFSARVRTTGEISLRVRNLLFATICGLVLTACGGGGGDSTTPAPAPQPSQFRIGGSVAGLNGSVGLQLNGGGTLTVASNGAFTFDQQLNSGASYQVAISSQPAGQLCAVTAGSGTANADVSTIRVECNSLPRPVTAIVSGLTGSVVLHLNGIQVLSLGSNGAFTFPEPLQQGATYQLTIAQQPTGQECELGVASGIVGADAPNVTVTCYTAYLVGVSFSAVHGDLVVRNNGDNDLTISSPSGTSNGFKYFARPLRSGASYNITIHSQPNGQRCTLSGGQGAVGTTDNSAAATIVCETIVPTYTVGGTVTGLHGPLTLRNNGVDHISLTGDGLFTFGTVLSQASSYNVTIESQPPTQQCTVTGGSGTITNSNITSVAIRCVDLTPHRLEGRMIGVTSDIVLRNRGGDPLTLASEGSFSFMTLLYPRMEYDVTVTSANPAQRCLVARGTGTMPDAHVDDIRVTCSTKRATRFVYVVNDGDSGNIGAGISQFAVGSDGSLTPIAPAKVTAGVRPGSITVDPSGRFVYVRSSDGAAPATLSYWQFAISSGGSLTPLSTQSISTSGTTGHLVIDRDTTFAYAARGGDILRFPLNPAWLYNATTFPWLIKAEPFGEKLYVAAPGSIASFIIDPTGTLSPGTPERVLAPFGSFTAFALDLAGTYVYAAAGDFVHVYQTGANGALTHIEAATIATGPRPVAMAVRRKSSTQVPARPVMCRPLR